MSRPAQLEQQIARAQELQAKLTEGDTEIVVNDDEQTPPDSEPKEPVAPVVVSEPPATITKEDYDKLEQRYRTLQGMHAADVNRFRNELKSATDAIKDLEDRLIAAETAKVKTPELVKYITDEDESEYGDTLEMVRRAAREEAENLAIKREAALMEKIAELQDQLGYVRNNVVPKVENITRAQQDQIVAEFWAAIDTHVPNWKEINDNQAFKDWLLTVDPLLGANKQYFLRQAQQQYDASRVIGFFKEWERIQAGGQTPAPKNTAQSELEKHIAPGASKGSVGSMQVEPKVWTPEEVGKFYADITAGKYRDRLEERKKIENDIFLAQKEGRFKR